jgi:hypothetical protein
LFLAPGLALAESTPSGTDDARMLTAAPRGGPTSGPTAPRGPGGTDAARGVGRAADPSGTPAARQPAAGGTDAARGIGAAPLGMLRPRG